VGRRGLPPRRSGGVMVKLVKQLSVFLENRPGGMARICGILAEANINILALSVHDTVDHAIVRLIVEPHVKALLLLEHQGLYLLEQEVVMMKLENRPGELADLARLLARADINIAYAYCTATEDQGSGCLVLSTDDPRRTVDVLAGVE